MEKNRPKGLSPLLAAVLLIAFVVALSTVIFGFLSTTFRATTATIANRTTESVDCSSAIIKIEDVYIQGSPSANIRILVRNSGLADNLILQNATVFNTTGGIFAATALPVPDFDKGELYTVLITGTNNVAACPASFSKAIVTTSCSGVSDIFDSTPKCS